MSTPPPLPEAGAAEAPVQHIDLDEALVCQVHASLHNGESALARLIAETQAALASGPVCWCAPVTPRNVHCIESLLLLARLSGCSVEFASAEGLDERESAFFEDVRAHYREQTDTGVDTPPGSAIGAHAAFARDCLTMLLRMPSAMLRRRRDVSGRRFRHATLVGLYGDEHVGDIAILGGVLLRLHRQFGVQAAFLFSQRPEYTRRLAAHLDTPVALTVLPGEPALLNHELRRTEALVWAGGPLMDLPPVLVRQLAAIYAVRRRGRPVLLEGIGIGPFRHAASRWVARRIARAADRVAVRTAGAAQDPVLEGIEAGVGQDPAFDYLATRGELTRLDPRERSAIDTLLQGTDGHIVVAINLRPIRHYWSGGGESWSRVMQDRFLQHLAVAMTDYARLAPAPVSYVYFPMNLIQAGCSDLFSAWRLNRLLHKGLDLRVWQADPDIDALLYLLRRAHMALAMRFHACIFAMSQDIPTIGIDYYPGIGGKVEQLFRDRRRAEDIRRLDEADIHFMVERLLKNQPGGNNHPELYP